MLFFVKKFSIINIKSEHKIIKNLFNVLFIFILFLSSISTAEYNNSEGITNSQHLSELQKKLNTYVLTNKNLDLIKIENAIQYFNTKRKQYENSLFENEKVKLIEENNYDWEEALKKAKKVFDKERETLIAFDEVISRLTELKENYHIYSNELLESKIGDLGLFISITDTILHEHFQYDLVNMAVTLGRNFFKIPKNDKRPEASNLWYNNRFLNPDEIKELKKQGVDISKIDPPDSAFWTKNEVSKYDPNDVYLNGEKIFPKPEEPQEFYYNRMGDGTVKIKASWFDQEDLDKDDGKPKKKSITLRLGLEINSGTFASHLIRALGFHAVPSQYRQTVKLYLQDKSYDQFIAELNQKHGGDIYDHSAYILDYNQSENYVVLKGVCLESYPDEKLYQKMGPFRTGRNGFDNRRDYRTWLMNGTLISLNDTQDKQTRVDAIRSSKKEAWRPYFMMADMGYSMGSYLFFDNLGAVNDYDEKLSTYTKKSVMLWWSNGFDGWENYQHMTYADARWWLRRARQLSSDQLYTMAKLSGFPDPVARLYSIKIQKRINHFIEAFDLQKELGLFTPETYEQVHKDFPRYVNKNGKVTNAIEELPETNASLIGPFLAPREIITIAGQNVIHSKIEDLFSVDASKLKLNTEIDLGKHQLNYSIKLGRKRTVQTNDDKSQTQKRFQVKDVYEINIPIGLIGINLLDKDYDLKAPLSYYYNYKYTYYHSYSEPEEAFKSKFFSSMIPWNIDNIRKNLQTGENLIIEKSYGYNIGTIKAEAEDLFQVVFSPVSYTVSDVNKVFISKTSNHLEVATWDSNVSDIGSNFNLSAGLKFHLGANKGHQNNNYSIYRISSYGVDQNQKNEFNKRFNRYLYKNDLDELKPFAVNYNINSTERYKSFHAGAFLWSTAAGSNVKEINIENIEPENKANTSNSSNVDTIESQQVYELTSKQQSNAPLRDATVFLARDFRATDRSYGNFWIEDFDFKETDHVIDLIGDGINQGEMKGAELQTLASVDLKEIENMELKIYIRRLDTFASLKSFKKDIIDRFTDFSGIKDYFNFEIPNGVKYYSPLEVMMSWQINELGIENILSSLKKEKYNCTRTCLNNFKQVETLKKQLKFSKLSLQDRKKKLAKLTELILKQIKKYIYANYSGTNKLYKTVGEDNLWLYTWVDNVHKTDIPVSRNKFTRLFAKPVGKYQGDSYLRSLKETYFLEPHMDYEEISIDPDVSF